MVQTRETRASACEIKFLVAADLAPRLCHWARTHLGPDPHGSGPFGDEYQTSTIYFDTADLDVFARRQSYGRAKYRVRRYGEAATVFLERKLRKPGMLIKRRTETALSALDHLAQPGDGASWAGHWFERRLMLRDLHPVCQVSYHRTARMAAGSGPQARLTLDSDLRVTPVEGFQFSAAAGAPILDGRLILELKYHARVPAVFRHLIEEFALTPETASKYRLAMSALGHVQSSDPPRARGTGDSAYA